jgi:hypothetical protein
MKKRTTKQPSFAQVVAEWDAAVTRQQVAGASLPPLFKKGK